MDLMGFIDERARGLLYRARARMIMTTLFRRLQPTQKFRISIGAISQLLKIPKHLILRVECWAYVVFVHRRDKGGQFIS